MPNKKEIYSKMKNRFVEPTYEQPEFTEQELKDKNEFEKYLQGRVHIDRYAMLRRLVNDVMFGRIKSAAFPEPTAENFDEVCEHIWKVTEMDRFYINQKHDAYGKYRSDVGTLKVLKDEALKTFESYEKEPERYRNSGDLTNIYALGSGSRKSTIDHINDARAYKNKLRGEAIDTEGHIRENFDAIFKKTEEEKNIEQWNEAYNLASKEAKLDEPELKSESKSYRFFSNEKEITKEEAKEAVAAGKKVSYIDEHNAISMISADKNGIFTDRSINPKGDYKKEYKQMLETLNKGTSRFTRSSREYANMRDILGKLSKGAGNEKELLSQLAENYRVYAEHHAQKEENGKDSARAILRKECADKMNEQLMDIMASKKAIDARFENEIGFSKEKYAAKVNNAITSDLAHVSLNGEEIMEKYGITAYKDIIGQLKNMRFGSYTKEDILALKDSCETFRDQTGLYLDSIPKEKDRKEVLFANDVVNLAEEIAQDIVKDQNEKHPEDKMVLSGHAPVISEPAKAEEQVREPLEINEVKGEPNSRVQGNEVVDEESRGLELDDEPVKEVPSKE